MSNSVEEAVTFFAYGSNMLTARMAERVASARVTGTALLERFALRWTKPSQDGSGKCSIEDTGRRDDSVWGVLYELNAADKKKLDEFEGVGRGYEERRVTVLSNGQSREVVAYYATTVDPNIRPYDWYRELVIAGAREHKLPLEYIRDLEAVDVAIDSNAERAARARQALAVAQSRRGSADQRQG